MDPGLTNSIVGAVGSTANDISSGVCACDRRTHCVSAPRVTAPLVQWIRAGKWGEGWGGSIDRDEYQRLLRPETTTPSHRGY